MSKPLYKSGLYLLCAVINGTEAILATSPDRHALNLNAPGSYTRPDYADGFDWQAYEDGEFPGACWDTTTPTEIEL
ncbi:MAG: hypothetical protein WC047_00210 [Kiritimatiellales bacterium]